MASKSDVESGDSGEAVLRAEASSLWQVLVLAQAFERLGHGQWPDSNALLPKSLELSQTETASASLSSGRASAKTSTSTSCRWSRRGVKTAACILFNTRCRFSVCALQELQTTSSELPDSELVMGSLQAPMPQALGLSGPIAL